MSEFITLTASKPGSSPPKVEKRSGDSRLYMVDCSALLTQNELIIGKPTAVAPVALTISDIKSKRGKSIVFRVEGGPATTASVEYLVTIKIRTTVTNLLEVPILVKAYAV